MNKYQKDIVDKIEKLSLLSYDGHSNGNVEIRDSVIEIRQNENYNIEKYVLTFSSKAIEKVEYFIDSWINAKVENDVFKITIDFNNKIKEIRLSFPNNLIEQCVLTFKYIEADRSLFDKKILKQKREALLKVMDVYHRYGENLINIYWNNSCDLVYSTIIKLFIEKNSDYQLIATYIINDNIFYKSINDLAYGSFAYEIIQNDKDDNLIISSDKINFRIEEKIKNAKIIQPSRF